MSNKRIFRVNFENVDMVLERTGKLIDTAQIYGSKVLIEDMEKNLKTEYMKAVGKCHYQSGIGLNDPRNLMSNIEISKSTPGRLSIQVKNGATVPRAQGSNGMTKVEDILGAIQKGWAWPSKHKVFKLAPDRPNMEGVMGGYMKLTGQRPKPFVANTVKNYTEHGVTNAGTIMEREIAKILKRGI